MRLKDTLNQLTTTLKEQEKAVGQNQRNVGNYANDIGTALSQITGYIPGMQQFGGVIQGATKVIGFLPSAFSKAGNSITSFFQGNPGRNVIQGFGKMEQSAANATSEVEKTAEGLETVAPAAAEAETGLAAMAPAGEAAAGGLAAVSAGTIATGGAIAGLVIIIAGAINYMKSLGSVGLKTAQIFDGIKASALMMFDDIAKGNFAHMGEDMKGAYNGAVQLKKGMQALARTEQQSDVTVANYDREIAANMLALRYRKITFEQAVQIDKETGKLEDDRVKLKQENLRKEYNLTVANAINAKSVTQEQSNEITNILQSGNLKEIQQLEKHDKIMKGTSESIHDIELKIIAAQQEADLSEQKTINRQAIIEQRFAKQGAKFAAAQTSELAQANANIREAEEVRILSIARQMEFQMSAYGKELAAADAHYQEMIYKEMQFIAQQEKLAKLAKSPVAKEKFLEAAAEGKKAIDQLSSEWDTDIQKHYQDNNEKMLDLVIKSDDELKKVVIAGLKDVEQKQIEELTLDRQVKQHAYQIEKKDREKQIADLKADATKASGERKSKLLEDATYLEGIQKNADKQEIEEAKQTAEAILKVKRDAANKEKELTANTGVLKAQNADDNDPSAKNDKALLDAQQEELRVKTAAELSNENLTAAEALNIYNGYLNKKAALDREYNEKRTNDYKKYEAAIQDAAFSILKNATASQAEYTMAALEKSKTFELNNQSLTSTQKAQIENKYRIAEGQAKQKEFRTNQKIANCRSFS